MDLYALVRTMQEDGVFDAIAGNPLAQFGVPSQPLLGATILPERLVPQNMYKETAIRYRAMIANDAERYSPVQIKAGGELIGEMTVELGNQNIGRQMTPQDYDGLLELLGRNADMSAIDTLTGWVDSTLNQGLQMVTEKQRWEALVSAQVTRDGDNGFHEVVQYPNPAGQRVAAGGVWSNDAYDPFDDITAIKEYAAGLGYQLNRAFTSTAVAGIMQRNTLVKTRGGAFRQTNATTDFLMTLNRSGLDTVFAGEGLPVLETYDLTYRTQNGALTRYLPNTVMVFTATTDSSVEIDVAANERVFMPSTLGYTALGRATGQSAPGRVIQVTPIQILPPHLEGRAWQTSLPVITEPEAVFVINAIA